MKNWKDEARCVGLDTNLFFDKYEDDKSMSTTIDKLCMACPVRKKCFAVGVSNKEWGVYGGVYLKDGNIDREHNNHKTKKDWFNIWKSLTMEES
jgi:hypothetical protein